jgi:hypothetical protein
MRIAKVHFRKYAPILLLTRICICFYDLHLKIGLTGAFCFRPIMALRIRNHSRHGRIVSFPEIRPLLLYENPGSISGGMHGIFDGACTGQFQGPLSQAGSIHPMISGSGCMLYHSGCDRKAADNFPKNPEEKTNIFWYSFLVLLFGSANIFLAAGAQNFEVFLCLRF